MTSAAHENEKTIELLLSSISNDRDTGLCHSFFFGKPGSPLWERQIGVEIFYNRAKLIQAALNLRKSGPAYLRYLPIGDIWSMLQNFMSDYFSLIADDVLFWRIDGPYSERVSSPSKANLVRALSQSSIFTPKPALTLFPLVTVQVQSDFESDVFSFIPPESLPAPTASCCLVLLELRGSFQVCEPWCDLLAQPVFRACHYSQKQLVIPGQDGIR